MYCLTCDADKHPTQVYTSKGLVDACPSCQGVFARLDDAAPASGVEHVAPVRVPAPAIAPGTGDDIVRQMRARLVFVEAEIAARVKYDVERDRLRRMLAAAGEDEPQPEIVALN